MAVGCSTETWASNTQCFQPLDWPGRQDSNPWTRGPSNPRRHTLTAVHLVERVLPHVPYRQWTLSFPHRVRWVLLKDVGLLSDVLTVFPRAVFALQRRRARRQGIRRGQVGAVSFIQFFGLAE